MSTGHGAHDLSCPEITEPLAEPVPDRCTCRDVTGHLKLAHEKILNPGVYDIPAAVYHADPVDGGSLSSSGARKLLAPSCPALFRHWADHGQAPRAAFDIGHAAHREVLGVGEDTVVVPGSGDDDAWTTKSAKAAVAEARAAGKTPIKPHVAEAIQGMAAALRAHPIASALFDPAHGQAEQTLVWRDGATGLNRRAMLDWLPYPADGQRVIVADYKTTRTAEPSALARAMSSYGYAQQAAWYLDGITALNLTGGHDPAFVFVFQEKEPPFLVTVAQPDPDSITWGRRLNRKALDVYRHCTRTGIWPGYADEVISLGLPPWAVNQLDAAWERGDFEPIDTEDVA